MKTKDNSTFNRIRLEVVVVLVVCTSKLVDLYLCFYPVKRSRKLSCDNVKHRLMGSMIPMF